MYCHSNPGCTPQSGYRGVTKDTKNADMAKMAENCINCRSARPTPPTQTLWIQDLKTPFQLKFEKTQKILNF